MGRFINTLRVAASPFGKRPATEHLKYSADEHTLCGLDAFQYSEERETDLTTQVNSPRTCKRCKGVLLK